MVYVKPMTWLQGNTPTTKTFSYSEVEALLCELVYCLNNTEILNEQGIEIVPLICAAERGVDLYVKKDNRTSALRFSLEAR